MPRSAGGVDYSGLIALLIVVGVVLSPLLLGRRGSPPGESEPGSDGGPGGGPSEPPTPPRPPRGTLPLDEAVPSRVRLRDHRRLADRLPGRDRRARPAHDRPPSRTPKRT